MLLGTLSYGLPSLPNWMCGRPFFLNPVANNALYNSFTKISEIMLKIRTIMHTTTVVNYATLEN